MDGARLSVAFEMHGSVGGDDAVERRDDHEAVGTNELAFRRGIHGAAAAYKMSTFVELNQAAAVRLRPVIAMILECRQNMAVRHSYVGVRVHITVEITERCCKRRVQRLTQVEKHGPSALKRIGQKKTVLGHFRFGVMRRSTGTGNCD